MIKSKRRVKKCKCGRGLSIVIKGKSSQNNNKNNKRHSKKKHKRGNKLMRGRGMYLRPYSGFK